MIGARRRDRRAFTLIEMLVSIALILALLGAMFAFSWDLLSARAQILEVTGRARAAQVLVAGLERDLLTTIVGDPRRAGVKGDNERIQVVSRAVPARLLGRARVDAAVAFADLERTTYRFDGGRLTARRQTLLRRGASDDGAATEVLDDTIGRIRFRYHDGEAWRDTCDSAQWGRLPHAVEVAIWFDDDQPPDEEGAPTALLERGTFDAAAGFDERAFALAADFEEGERPPDRLRVIAVPDPWAQEDDADAPR